MVNIFNCYFSILHKLAKLAGLQPTLVEIEPGTVINFWMPSKPSKKPKQNVVLIHGFAGNGILTWQFQALSSSLRKKYSLYIPELLFFGASHTTQPDRTLKFHAECMAKGLRKIGVDKCIVVGFSYGGFLGFEMARNYPTLVQSLVVTGADIALTETTNTKILDKLGYSSFADLLLPHTAEGVKTLLETGAYKLPKLPKILFKHALEVMFDNRNEKKELLEALVVKDEDVPDHQYQQPIHLIWGSEDKIITLDDIAVGLKEKLGKGTRLITMEKAGHIAQIERPFAFNKCLKEVLASLDDERVGKKD